LKGGGSEGRKKGGGSARARREDIEDKRSMGREERVRKKWGKVG